MTVAHSSTTRCSPPLVIWALCLVLTALAIACGSSDATLTGTATQSVGEPCNFDTHCFSGECEVFGSAKICTDTCDEDCANGLICFEGSCAPNDYCEDRDGDGHGNGPGCAGSDCNDAKPNINSSAPEVCENGLDDNCNTVIDEGCDENNQNNNPDNNSNNNSNQNNSNQNNSNNNSNNNTNQNNSNNNTNQNNSNNNTNQNNSNNNSNNNMDPCAGEPCDANATCTVDGEGFECMCDQGYVGDGLTCAIDDSCVETCDPNALCIATGDGMACQCNDGFTGDGTSCADIDECALGTSGCPAASTCQNLEGDFACECLPGAVGADCSLQPSCRGILNVLPSAPSGDYFISTTGTAGTPIEVYCDMDADLGAGYTMLRIDDVSLQAEQAAYQSACGDLGMEIIVPRTRAHAAVIKTWNNGVEPNIVNVLPQTERSEGLAGWEGRCGGDACGFYLSDLNTSDCDGDAPTGNPGADLSLVRVGDGCSYGRWDAVGDAVVTQGYVICSTNDAGPPPLSSCRELLENNSVSNVGADGISGIYTLTGGAPYDAYCDMDREGGGWTLALKANGEMTTFRYSSPLWTTSELLAPDMLVPDDAIEAKFESFNSVAFDEIFVEMVTLPDGELATLRVPVAGQSLLSLFAAETHVPTALGVEAWLGLVDNSALQRGCFIEGLNAFADGSRVRIGVLGDQQDDCSSPESRLGVGGAGDACRQTEELSVGNNAHAFCGAIPNSRLAPALARVYVR